jgi:hypothetical protein
MEEKEVRNEVPAPETDRKKEEKRKRNLPRNRYSNEEDAGLPAYGTGFLGVYVPDFCTVRQG